MVSESFNNSLTDSALEELYEEFYQLGIHKKSYSLIDTNYLKINVLSSDATKITGKMRNTYILRKTNFKNEQTSCQPYGGRRIPECDDDVLIKSKVHEETYTYGRKQNLLAVIPKAQVPAQTSRPVITTEDRKSEENISQAQIVKNQPITYVEQNQSNLPNLPNPSIELQLTPVSDTQYPF
ncbi:hypothetical protein GcM1_224041 [Golovinomyces cichoracearum]|uniref:Uncharacterized protein n=1 Tax=Golovinomyces cichoracearum TaxID=62708 RepID=A0A420IQM9_9PEZI|nr:hypothetical protein GcM1_224041 [Golovinomyces cichoracearum]